MLIPAVQWVNQLRVHTCPRPPEPPPALPTPLGHHRAPAESPLLCRRCPPAGCLTQGSEYVSMLLSELIPPSPPSTAGQRSPRADCPFDRFLYDHSAPLTPKPPFSWNIFLRKLAVVNLSLPLWDVHLFPSSCGFTAREDFLKALGTIPLKCSREDWGWGSPETRSYILPLTGILGLPGVRGKETACQCRGLSFDPWVGKISYRRKWQPTPVFLPRESYGQESLADYSPWDHRRIRHNFATEQQQQRMVSWWSRTGGRRLSGPVGA